MLYNPHLRHKPDQYHVDNSRKSMSSFIVDTIYDLLTILLGESGLKLWVRAWLAVLLVGMFIPLPFLPHPFALANVAALPVILVVGGAELARVRGMNKKMISSVHWIAWTPVMIVNILSLTTDKINLATSGSLEYEKLSWDNAGENGYGKARFVAVILNTVILGISLLFDANDAVQYFILNNQEIERSQWTTEQLEKAAKGIPSTLFIDDKKVDASEDLEPEDVAASEAHV